MIDSKGIMHLRLFPTKSTESGKVVSVLKMPILLVSLEGTLPGPSLNCKNKLTSLKNSYINAVLNHSIINQIRFSLLETLNLYSFIS